MQRESLLFLTTELPYPADSGGKIKSFRLLEYLVGIYDVKLLCAYGGERHNDLKQLQKRLNLSGIQAFTNQKERSALHFFNALMGSPTFNAYRVYSKELETMVQWSAATSDIIIVDHLEMISLLPEKTDKTIIYHSHNAEHVLWEEFSKTKGNWATKWIYDWEASRVKNLERYALRRANKSFAAPNDRERLVKIPGVDASKIENTFHLGNDALLSLPPVALQANTQKVFYAGTLSWEPNRDGLVWFIEQVWPLVCKVLPSAELQVCGRGADNELLALFSKTEKLTYHGFVEDLNEVMKLCLCAIVPLRIGSGMKIKTFDALYRGLPLVSTRTGVEGIEIENNVHGFIVDDAEGYGKAVARLLENPTQGEAMRDKAREICKEKYMYAPMLENMALVLRSARDQKKQFPEGKA